MYLQIFSEKPSTSSQGVRCVNFITGAGGLLQAVIFGYGGVRYRMSSLTINPYVLPNTTSWALRGLKYRGFTLDLEIRPKNVTVTLRSTPQNEQKRDLTFQKRTDRHGFFSKSTVPSSSRSVSAELNSASRAFRSCILSSSSSGSIGKIEK
jgi:hypothetical protein